MLSKLLKNKRFDKKITQQEIAKILNMSVSAYNNKELGKTQFTLDEFVKLIEILNITSEEVLQVFSLKQKPQCEVF